MGCGLTGGQALGRRRLAIDRAAAAISLALLAERDARSASDQARSALIGDVISGRLGNADDFLRRANSLGMKPAGAALAVLALEPHGLGRLRRRGGPGRA